MNTRLGIHSWESLNATERSRVLERPAMRDSSEISNAVRTIVANAREGGEQTLLRYTAELDGVQLESIAVSSEEIAAAPGMLTDPQRNAISTAIDNVRKFHAAQITQDLKVETVPGVICERVSRPIQAVGLYVPAGSAPLPSTAVMLAAPAELANCPVRVLCTPPRPDGRADPAVIFAASSCGVRNMFKLGGAQAVAAMAYGISPVPKVDKIFGPGNAYVTAAKSMVAMDPGGADLDLPAGPSEVMVIADQAASPLFVAMDLLSQAEHGADSQVILVTDDMNLANAVRQETFAQTERLPRKAIINAALEHASIIVTPDIEAAMAIANRYAPEHLILQLSNARDRVAEISHAGSVFVGPWTPESVGDYCSGTNHVLPTYGYAKSMSGLSVNDFTRQLTIQELTRDGLTSLAPVVTELAGLEGLDAHAKAVTARLSEPAE